MHVQKTLSSHVLLSSFLPRSNRTTLQHRSIEFLTTQTDQSKGDNVSLIMLFESRRFLNVLFKKLSTNQNRGIA